MSIAYIIHAEADLSFVKETLIRPLPVNGFDRWISSESLPDQDPQPFMAQCQVILAVLSRKAADSPLVHDQIAVARMSPTPTIAVLAENLSDDERKLFALDVWLLPFWDRREVDQNARQELAALLPSSREESGTTLEGLAEPIEWNEEIFSEALRDVLKVHDQNRARTLINRFTTHIEKRAYPYPEKHANNDLAALRSDRQFRLMRSYGAAVIASGTHNEKVRRQYAQALIEQREFEEALKVLNSIVEDPTSKPSEVVEAYGLIGRNYKQQYLDAPESIESHALLLLSIQAYRSVYEKDQKEIWHGVNMASCIVRAHRDGIKDVQLSEAGETAFRLLEEIKRLEETEEIKVWDYATRVEALVILERYDEAMTALDRYICHPDLDAFAVSSTYRQFDQLLQLGENPLARPIFEKLWEAVRRSRGMGFADEYPASEESGETSLRPLLIRVADPNWQPGPVTDLVLETRLGTIISAQGSEQTVKALLTDPDVISVNESAQVGISDCDRSIPFIKVAKSYPSAGGPYEEEGGRALIAIIDNGIDVLHKAFLDANGNSRIVGIWDQKDGTGTFPNGFGYGTYHDENMIAEYIRVQKVPQALGRNLTGHGTHVASIAAGRKIDKPGKFAGGVAPEARLLVVIADGRSSIGYSKSHLDALSFIDQMATKLGLPVVVNVSQGMNAGAHDGKSALEVGFDAFTGGGRTGGRVIVKSAGNERHKKGHAKVTLGDGAEEILPWQRYPNAKGKERLELWWNSADEFAFRLHHPAGDWTPWLSTINPTLKSNFADGTAYTMEFTRRHIDNGDSLLRIEIGTAGVAVPHGPWELNIQSQKVCEGGDIHAWIERAGGDPSSFEDFIDLEMTLSIPGTAQSVITVGAVGIAPLQVGKFSSFGPTRDQRKKPEVAAPGVGVNAALAGTSEDAVSMDGTSMAAPHVTGAIALLLSRVAGSGQALPAASQISSALRQKTQNYNSKWDRGQGFGVVDVEALLSAF